VEYCIMFTKIALEDRGILHNVYENRFGESWNYGIRLKRALHMCAKFVSIILLLKYFH